MATDEHSDSHSYSERAPWHTPEIHAQNSRVQSLCPKSKLDSRAMAFKQHAVPTRHDQSPWTGGCATGAGLGVPLSSET